MPARRRKTKKHGINLPRGQSERNRMAQSELEQNILEFTADISEKLDVIGRAASEDSNYVFADTGESILMRLSKLFFEINNFVVQSNIGVIDREKISKSLFNTIGKVEIFMMLNINNLDVDRALQHRDNNGDGIPHYFARCNVPAYQLNELLFRLSIEQIINFYTVKNDFNRCYTDIVKTYLNGSEYDFSLRSAMGRIDVADLNEPEEEGHSSKVRRAFYDRVAICSLEKGVSLSTSLMYFLSENQHRLLKSVGFIFSDVYLEGGNDTSFLRLLEEMNNNYVSIDSAYTCVVFYLRVDLLIINNLITKYLRVKLEERRVEKAYQSNYVAACGMHLVSSFRDCLSRYLNLKEPQKESDRILDAIVAACQYYISQDVKYGKKDIIKHFVSETEGQKGYNLKTDDRGFFSEVLKRLITDRVDADIINHLICTIFEALSYSQIRDIIDCDFLRIIIQSENTELAREIGETYNYAINPNDLSKVTYDVVTSMNCEHLEICIAAGADVSTIYRVKKGRREIEMDLISVMLAELKDNITYSRRPEYREKVWSTLELLVANGARISLTDTELRQKVFDCKTLPEDDPIRVAVEGYFNEKIRDADIAAEKLLREEEKEKAIGIRRQNAPRRKRKKTVQKDVSVVDIYRDDTPLSRSYSKKKANAVTLSLGSENFIPAYLEFALQGDQGCLIKYRDAISKKLSEQTLEAILKILLDINPAKQDVVYDQVLQLTMGGENDGEKKDKFITVFFSRGLFKKAVNNGQRHFLEIVLDNLGDRIFKSLVVDDIVFALKNADIEMILFMQQRNLISPYFSDFQDNDTLDILLYCRSEDFVQTYLQSLDQIDLFALLTLKIMQYENYNQEAYEKVERLLFSLINNDELKEQLKEYINRNIDEKRRHKLLINNAITRLLFGQVLPKAELVPIVCSESEAIFDIDGLQQNIARVFVADNPEILIQYKAMRAYFGDNSENVAVAIYGSNMTAAILKEILGKERFDEDYRRRDPNDIDFQIMLPPWLFQQVNPDQFMGFISVAFGARCEKFVSSYMGDFYSYSFVVNGSGAKIDINIANQIRYRVNPQWEWESFYGEISCDQEGGLNIVLGNFYFNRSNEDVLNAIANETPTVDCSGRKLVERSLFRSTKLPKHIFDENREYLLHELQRIASHPILSYQFINEWEEYQGLLEDWERELVREVFPDLNAIQNAAVGRFAC